MGRAVSLAAASAAALILLSAAVHAAPPTPGCGCGPTAGGAGGGSGGGQGGGSGGGAGAGSGGGGGGGAGGAGGSASSSSTGGASRSYSYSANWAGALLSSTSATGVSTSSTGVVNSNAQAQVNAASSGYGGGGGGFSESGGVTTTIEQVRVETPGESHRVCAAYRAQSHAVRLVAVCMDDKDVPHPASQVSPEKQLGAAYEGEVYRCIAGARLQYTLFADAGAGQSQTCRKGEALVRTAAGALECRPQKPARDCNERSLLRRFGAGEKLVEVGGAQVCVAWREETASTGPEVLN